LSVTEQTLLVSPHSDDMAMSAFGIITKKLLPGQLNLMTVFEWSNYIVPSQRTFASLRTLANSIPRPSELRHSLARNAGHFGNRPSKILGNLLDLKQPYKVTRIRLFEDIRFSKRTGMKFSYLNFPCCKCRYGRAITDPNWPLANDQEMMDKLYPVLKRVISRLNVRVIVAPWPYGTKQHVDHRLVNETATRISEDTGTKLFYVDDQPYSRRPLNPMVDRRGFTYDPTIVNLDPSERRRKFRAMSIYRSQMTPGYFRAVSRPPPGSPDQSFSETLWQPS
jgi:LmbE family N-acetylglucosaminyl deacetylase